MLSLSAAELASEQSTEVLPESTDQENIVRQLEDRFKDRLPDSAPSTQPKSNPSKIEALPTSGDPSDMARDLLKQVIPQGGSLPRSAAPLRDLGQNFLNAPAPGQGAALPAQSRVPAQSQLIQTEPF